MDGCGKYPERIYRAENGITAGHNDNACSAILISVSWRAREGVQEQWRGK